MSADQWSAFQKEGVFTGAPVDLADGYIHFSTAEQVAETAAKHFTGQGDLLVAWSEGDDLGDALKWEVSRGGAHFPHLYRHWQLSEVLGHVPCPVIDGVHQFPELIVSP